MKKLKKCVGALCCAGMLGCTGAGQNVRPLPPPEDCPPGSAEAMEKYGISFADWIGVATLREGYTDGASVRLLFHDGPLFGWYAEGRVYFGDGRVYGRFVKAVKGNTSVPICMALLNPSTRDWGIPANTSETPAKANEQDYASVLKPVARFP